MTKSRNFPSRNLSMALDITYCPTLWNNGTPLQHSCLENPMDGGASLQPMGSRRVGHD